MNATLSPDGKTLTVTIPFKMQQRGGRKLIVTPDGGTSCSPALPRPDDTLVRALARACRWQRMLDNGEYGTIRDIEKAEGVTNSYVSRVLKLNLLAPDIVAAILDGRQPKALQLEQIAYAITALWADQRKLMLQQVAHRHHW